MPIHWHPPIITSTIITCFLRGTLTNQTTPISIPLSTIKGQIFAPALVLSLTYWSMFIALLSATSDHYVTREQTQTKEKTFKHFTVLERSKLLHWCCSWKGQVFTIHALNCQSPSTAAGSAKLKPSETSVSLDLQNTSLTTEPAITNSVALKLLWTMKPFQLHIIKINHSFYQLSHRKIRSQYRISRNLLRPLQTSDQLLHSSPTSKACLLSNVVREDPHLTST